MAIKPGIEVTTNEPGKFVIKGPGGEADLSQMLRDQFGVAVGTLIPDAQILEESEIWRRIADIRGQYHATEIYETVRRALSVTYQTQLLDVIEERRLGFNNTVRRVKAVKGLTE